MYRENRFSSCRRDGQGFITSAIIGAILGVLVSILAVFGA